MQFRSVFCLGLVAIVIAIAWSFSSTHAQQPQTEPAAFVNLQVIPYPNGMTGFFDERTGVLYLYDSHMDECVYIRKLERLGEPLKHMRDAAPAKPKAETP
jgi:hypothetical protein